MVLGGCWKVQNVNCCTGMVTDTQQCAGLRLLSRPIEGYECCRCSPAGDSFSIYSFVIFPWVALRKFLPSIDYSHLLCERMGLAPGYATKLLIHCPLQRRLAYGGNPSISKTPRDLERILLSKVNHTGIGMYGYRVEQSFVPGIPKTVC